jgi:uncharacterized protein YjgD (DUF1641 family)
MNEEDLRDCFAMMKAITGANPEECFRFADEMLEARKHKEKENEEDIGIAAIVPKRTRKR